MRVKRDDKEYLMMASNNYLGLTFDTRVIEGGPERGLNNMEQALVDRALYLVRFHYLQSLSKGH